MLTRIIAAISLTMDCVPWGGCIGCLWLAADICAMVGVFVVLLSLAFFRHARKPKKCTN